MDTAKERPNGSIAWDVVVEWPSFMVIGSILALTMANDYLFSHNIYHEIVHMKVMSSYTLHFIVNDILMALFFALAGKEIAESTMLSHGSLHGFRKAALPLVSTAGGMLGPALSFIAFCFLFGHHELANGWAIPTATDIAFSALFAQFVFGKKHPAFTFLLLIAVADDGGGLALLATFYPTGPMDLYAFAILVGLAIAITKFMTHRLAVRHWMWYLLLPGSISWLGFYLGGIHPALSLVPIVFMMPHGERDLGLFASGEAFKHDALNEMETAIKPAVAVILGLFGFCNAGVEFGSIGQPTAMVVTALVLGKPVGIVLFTLIGLALGLKLPDGMSMREVVLVGLLAGIGFTVALFVTNVAFPHGFNPAAVDALKMGALLSAVAGPIAIIVAKILRVQRVGA